MTSSAVDTYVRQLRRELRRRFVSEGRILDEVRGHLADAAARACELGASPDAAEAEAVGRFGTPALVAEAFAADRTRVLHRCLLVAATMAGLSIAFIDSRPAWDDAGITAGAMLLSAALLGVLGPRRPWLWALAVGLWVPLLSLVRTPTLGSASMFLVLALPLIGAYAGRSVRRLITFASA